ncbi:response regulator [Caldimonas sp. KR1-144]|uniref:response regulator n=1 Tax=Caldimonas sp. KR1-144 TaxID=3400911 RepID=UPI003C10063B
MNGTFDDDTGAAQREPPRADADAANAPAEDERSSILIVDDLPEKLLVFETILEDLGQNLVFARSGADALREVLRREFAVILLDVNMPDIDGFETASLLRRYKKSAHTPIIFITSYADEVQTIRGYSLGAVDFILSPVIPAVLRSKVKVFVELHTMRQRAMRQGDERAARMAAEARRLVAEQNDKRSHFLAEASRMLSESLDIGLSEQRLVELLLTGTADRVFLVRTDDGATIERGLAGCAGQALVRPLEPSAFGAALQAVVVDVLQRKRRVELGSSARAELDRLLPGETPGAAAAVAVPLRSARHAIGALVVASLAGEPDTRGQDWSILEELAARAAIAFENAQLYHSLQRENAERVQAEAQLHIANRRKDEFLAMLGHELRNPLAPLRNALEYIRRVMPVDDKTAWAGEVMDRQLEHMTHLIEELLDVARISEGKITLSKESVELREVVHASVETAQPFIDQHGHRLTVQVPDTPIWMQGDFGRLAQVIGNLLNNAAKNSADGSPIELALSIDGGQAVLTVSDHGVGIDPALLPTIFELFVQGQRSLDRAQGGLGVGLTLVRRIVELHGGSVEAHSEGSNRGAVFTVRLPAVSVVQRAETEVSEQAAPCHIGQRILIVDDNRDAAASIAQFLQLEGHEVKFVGDGQQALSCVPVFAPQVVVLDIGLPGLSGYDLARRLRSQPPTERALLIALTGYGQREDRLLAIEAGFDQHFVKPTDPYELAGYIARWSQARDAADARSPRPVSLRGDL